jgi:RHS repeat-associated protein
VKPGFLISISILLVASTFDVTAHPQAAPTPQFGIVPSGAYQTYNVDAMNMSNLNDVITIPLFSLPQLGKLSLSFSAVANTSNWQPDSYCSPDGSQCQDWYSPNFPNYGMFGGGYGLGPAIVGDNFPGINSDEFFQTCPNTDLDCVSTLWSVTDGSGGSYSLYYNAASPTQLRTIDGSGYLFLPGVTAPWAWSIEQYGQVTGQPTLYDSHGIKYTWPSAFGSGNYVVSDPDSNTMTMSRSGSNPDQITDSVGRTVPPVPPATTPAASNCPSLTQFNQYQTPYSSAVWEVPGPNGNQVAYTICYTQVVVRTDFFGYGQENYSYNYEDQYGNPYTIGYAEDYQTFTAIQSIVLPDKTFWGFVYDGGNPNNENDIGHYGTITQLLFPLGGSITYGYSTYSPTTCYPPDATGAQWPGSATPTVATRAVSDNNGDTYSWTYGVPGQPAGIAGPGGAATDPNGNSINYIYEAEGNVCTGSMEQAEKTYQGGVSSGTLLQTVSKTYSTTPIPYPYPESPTWPAWANPAPLTVTATPDSRQFSTVTTNTYGESFTAEMATCGWTGSGACNLLESSDQDQVTVPLSIPTSVSTTDYTGSVLSKTSTVFEWQNNSNYLAANLLDTPSTITTYNASNSQVAQTTLTYDQTPYSSCGTCGHVTGMTQWLNGNPSASPTSYFGWAKGNLSYTIDPDNHENSSGHTVDYVYQGGSSPTFPYPSSVVNALNQTTSYTWDSDTGAMASVTDPNNQTTSYTYDCPSAPYNCSGRILSVGFPDEGSTQYAYSTDSAPTSFPVKVSTTVAASPDPSRTSVAIYDGAGRLIQTQLTTDPVATDYVNTTYDGLNNVVSVTNPFRSTSDATYGVTSYIYDALNRKVIQVQQDGTSKLQWCYDDLATNGQSNCHTHFGSETGAWTDAADESGNDRQITGDALGRIVEAAEPSGSGGSLAMETDYSYDALNDLLSVAQWGGAHGSSGERSRSFSYDSLARLLSATNPESGSVSYTYDANSNVVSKTDARSITVNYYYDRLNRLTQKEDSAGSFSYNYYYDNAQVIQSCSNVTNLVGRLCYATNNSNAAQFYSYDSMGRLKQQWYWTPQDPNFNASAYVGYDKAGSVDTVAYPDGRVVSQTFDGAGSLLSVSDQWNNYTSSLTHNAAGQLTGGNLGTGLQVSAMYDSRLAMTDLHYGTTYAWARNYTWNPNLTLQQEQNLLSGNTRKYGYDTLNRLTSALDVVTGTNNPASGGLSESYSYDQFGNLTQSGNFSFDADGYSPNNQPLPSEQLSGHQSCPSADWCFDIAGDLLADPLGNSYTWDGESKASSANGVVYTYYADGSRAGKTGSTPTDYVYFNGGLLTQYTGNNTWTDLIPGFNGTLAEARYSGGSSQPAYRYTDHLGSSVDVVAASGGGTQDYAPFGQLFDGDNTIDPYKFTGKEYDSESGNEYFGARFYSGVMGRFLSPDWSESPKPVPYALLANPQSLNLYSYALNNPLASADPSGHCVFDADFCNYLGIVAAQQPGAQNQNQQPLIQIIVRLRLIDGSRPFGCNPNTNLVCGFAYMALVRGGHHGLPRALYRYLPRGPARNFLRDWVTGPLEGDHFYDGPHRAYNEAVEELLNLDTPSGRQELLEAGLDGAKDAARKIIDSDNPAISNYLDNMTTKDGLTGRQALDKVLSGDADEAVTSDAISDLIGGVLLGVE